MSAAPLNSVVLAGGASSRMGIDKSLIRYHREPQVRHLVTMLEGLTERVFVSVRRGQGSAEFAGLRLIPDREDDVGPLEGVLGAFEREPGAAWLVVAVDMPFVTEQTLARLIAARAPQFCCTAYENPETGMPEPVLAIYEPTILSTLRKRKITGRHSLMVIQDLPHRLIRAADPRELRNVNTADEYEGLLNGGESGGGELGEAPGADSPGDVPVSLHERPGGAIS